MNDETGEFWVWAVNTDDGTSTVRRHQFGVRRGSSPIYGSEAEARAGLIEHLKRLCATFRAEIDYLERLI